MLATSAFLLPGGFRESTDSVSRLWFALAALVGSIGLFVRYLKFFRYYTLEVFLACISPTDS